mmetsp:Transcript_41186/g.74426  ORF Transcript_41186/g.74426 Transcript_41186/m.74426 type:complete len:449 (+) Transcript_41186:124-1470(+)
MRRIREAAPEFPTLTRYVNGRRSRSVGGAGPSQRAAPPIGATLAGTSDGAGVDRNSIPVPLYGTLHLTVLLGSPQRSEAQIAGVGTTWRHGLDDSPEVEDSASVARSSDCSLMPRKRRRDLEGLESAHVEEESEDRCCGICMEGFIPGEELTALPCSVDGCRSVWHTRCIRKWLCQGPAVSCPLCRKKFETGGNDPLSSVSFAVEFQSLTTPMLTGVPSGSRDGLRSLIPPELLSELVLLALLPAGAAHPAAAPASFAPSQWTAPIPGTAPVSSIMQLPTGGAASRMPQRMLVPPLSRDEAPLGTGHPNPTRLLNQASSTGMPPGVYPAALSRPAGSSPVRQLPPRPAEPSRGRASERSGGGCWLRQQAVSRPSMLESTSVRMRPHADVVHQQPRVMTGEAVQPVGVAGNSQRPPVTTHQATSWRNLLPHQRFARMCHAFSRRPTTEG